MFFFMSRYSVKAFWHNSSSLYMISSCFSRPSTSHTDTTCLTAKMEVMVSLNSASMPSKRFVSSGSCARISCEPKNMASRAAHARCTISKIRMTASIVPKHFCHCWISVRKKSTARPMAAMDCNWMLCSSSVSMRSSGDTITWTSVSLCLAISKTATPQNFSICLSFCSTLFSFCATSTISMMPSTCSCNCNLSKSARQKPGPFSTGL
mmetsp:Transcript_11791/g.30898  ORF Transcript_11791/g.30898 Transcript_11791/m.30898 type:complete len:208 (+) Transcript_11791:355-978(+)